MTIIRFISNNFFLKSKNIEKKYSGLSESTLKTEIFWTLLFCLLTPNYLFESDKFILSIFDEETGKINRRNQVQVPSQRPAKYHFAAESGHKHPPSQDFLELPLECGPTSDEGSRGGVTGDLWV